MTQFVASKTHLGEDGQIVRRGQRFTADAKREKALRKRGLIGGQARDRLDPRERDREASNARAERRLRKAFGIFQRAGVIPAEASFETFLEDFRRQNGGQPPRHVPEPRRTQQQPDPTRQDPPPIERKAEGGEGEQQPPPETETPPPADGEAEGGESGADGADGSEGDEDSADQDDQAPPPADPPVDQSTGRRLRGNRTPAAGE